MDNTPKIVQILRNIFKTFRLSLPKIGVGWMFALLTIDFNRIAIVELGIVAIAITSMLALHYFLSPFQVIAGRIADQNPILGYRRTPYLIVAGVVGSLVFVLLPRVVHAMGDGVPLAFVFGLLLFVVFGICIAVMGDSHHSLIAEVTEPHQRGSVIAVVWTFSIMSTIFAAVVMNEVRPEFTLEYMQRLYNLTPFIVVISILLGVLGMEKRLKGDELVTAMERSRQAAPPGNPIKAALSVLRDNPQARGFFAFVFVSIFSIFLQDNILEVFGAEVFAMDVTETTGFQPMWGGGVLIGMMIMGLISAFFKIQKRTITIIGSVGTAAGMGLVAMAALLRQEALVTPALIGMGFFTGFFNVGALSMMMDMTVEGATGLYMGLWGMAQAFGNAMASMGSGALHTAFIETGLLAPNAAYFLIFAVEAIGMLVAVSILLRLSVTKFQSITQRQFSTGDVVNAMQAGAAR
ncbi:MAG: BCD family MFS transporter [Anaerolineae bacterium]